MNADLYERQMKWRNDAMKKAEANTAKDIEKKNKDLTFQPHIYSAPVKKFEGSARDLTEKSGANHVLRQAKARKEKKSVPKTVNRSLPIELEREYSGSDDQKDGDDIRHQESFEFDRSDSILTRLGKDDEEIDEEHIVEMLERERREWQADRVKLIHCIHLQQLELTQRAVASHERATDIAKEFARVIEGFEERLLSVENNVHKEIMAIKGIAESLTTSSGATRRDDKSIVEERLTTLETGVDNILKKLDIISHAVARK